MPPIELPEEEPESTPVQETVVEVTSETPPVTLRGQCLDAESEEGLVGFTVRVSDDAHHSVEVSTGAEGRFELTWAGDGLARVSVLAREGWSEGLAARELTPEELTAENEILLHLPTLARATVQGTLLESRTRSPLPFLGVRVGEGVNAEVLQSDSQGGFSSTKEYPNGSIQVSLFDEDRDGSVELSGFEIEHVPEADEGLELTVDVGPTVMLEPSGHSSESGSDWRARIVERRGDPSLSGRLVRSPSRWVLTTLEDSVEERAWTWVPARTGSPPWIRYATVEHEPEIGFSANIQLRSSAGDFSGEAVLPSTTGVLRGPTRVVLRRVGSLVGKITDTMGSPVSHAKIWLSHDVDSQALGPWKPTPDGSYSMRDLDVGRYEMTVAAPLRPTITLVVELAPGENQQPEIVLAPEDSAFAIRGKFECRLSHGPAVVLLELESENGRDKRRKLLRRIKSSRRTTGTSIPSNEFSFASVPGGTYELRPISISGNHNWIPDLLTTATPTPPLLFRCGGSAASASMQLEAIDSASNGRVPGQELYLGPAKQPPFTWPESRPAERWYTLPTKSALTWTVWAPGYQPATGELLDLAGSGRKSPMQIELERGFGMRLVLRAGKTAEDQSRGNAPVIPGIEVLVDGESYGSSDENGELLLQLENAPERIEFLHPRWLATRVEPNENDEERLPVLCIWFEPR